MCFLFKQKSQAYEQYLDNVYLVLEFMGASYQYNKGFGKYYDLNINMEIPSSQYCVYTDFNGSAKWLLPVVEKINSIKPNHFSKKEINEIAKVNVSEENYSSDGIQKLKPFYQKVIKFIENNKK